MYDDAEERDDQEPDYDPEPVYLETKPTKSSTTDTSDNMPALLDAPLANTDNSRQWYVVHCYSGYENKVRYSIEQRIETMGMRDKIFDVIVPTQEEIEDTGLLPNPQESSAGVYVGGWMGDKKRLHYLRHNGPEHIAAIAPTRSGKGVGLVVPTLLTWPHSVVVNDMKGELWALTAGWRKHEARNVIVGVQRDVA